MMSLDFARILKEQQRFERELGDLVATTDILQRLTAAAEQASAAKAAFVASMRNDIRPPLHAVIGYSQLMLDQPRQPADDHILRDLKQHNREVQHLLTRS